MLTIRYFAGARAAAGVAEERLPVTQITLPELTAALTDRHGRRLGEVLSVASFLVDGAVWRAPERQLPETAVVEVLPPFAGG
ncbi:MoaD/ThiS family protein [Natronosporangium hydrolyticum]|uniref:MoaD/ThiS family protein n=1 Tax=Natronosporangium hydrolyticum TaxID=2811111 RepID=A0A895YAR9_9ACTN|nr:MoaD/ThiS family protein [Natronosporangium hydrolyticum]QSB14874.1 MoaD/ThiS family protein [Natronosporangium hydrolyticum]